MAAAFAAMHGQSNLGNCYGCGKPGHLKKNCPARGVGNKYQAPGICPRCRKGCHYANQCRSKYDFQGQLIQGNRSRSAGQQRAQIQVPQPTSQPPRREASMPQV
ncbi:POK9 protein, partial [Herpetotheres cachinnans]|nr:POK9 protein [Herpetotheres cachinnans]